MVILMDKYKNLVITKNTVLYQNENIVDNLTFLFPETYKDLELKDFTWTVQYVDPGNTSHIEVIDYKKDAILDVPIFYNKNDDGYTQYLQFVLPVDSEMTKIAGLIVMKVKGVYTSDEIVSTTTDADGNEVNTYKTYSLTTGELRIQITPLSDYFNNISDESLSGLDQKLTQLNRSIQLLEETQTRISDNTPDGLDINEESILSLTAKGIRIGTGVEIVSAPIDLDGDSEDGIIDIDTMSGSGVPYSPAVAIIDI